MIWIDTETTGLDPEYDDLLEISMCETDDYGTIRKQYSAVILPTGFDIDKVDPFIQKMHTDNGLIEECVRKGETLEDVEAEIIKIFFPSSLTSSEPLCGSSVHFDRMMLRAHMPTLLEKFHYRNFDISTVRAFIEKVDSFIGLDLFVPAGNHRAGSDVINSIALYTKCRAWAEKRKS